jgi:hypothetical protein
MTEIACWVRVSLLASTSLPLESLTFLLLAGLMQDIIIGNSSHQPVKVFDFLDAVTPITLRVN